MELDKVIDVLKNNNLSSKEILEWKSEKSFNLWHTFAATNNLECFNKISSIVSKPKLIEKLNEKNELGDLPVHLAAWDRNINILKSIVKVTNTLDVLDAQHRSVAMICLKTKDKELFEFSLKHTKNMNQKDRHSHSLLQYAQSYSDPATYQKLIDLGCIPEDKKKPLVHAIQEKEESILEFVRNHKKKIVIN